MTEEIAALKNQVNTMHNKINHLLGSIIDLNARITEEIQVAKITFHDIEVLKSAHQPESEHFRHVHKEGDL